MNFSPVTAVAKANVYFDGKVVSHTILFPDESKKTLGLIYPGSYHFGTAAAERMEITDGTCEVVIDGTTETKSYAAGTHFDVAANSGFTISVSEGICQYVCSFLS
jgi:purine/pyrimidine-nucleoside phosphorylase